MGGKVNLLNLAAIKERLGPKWPRYEQQVHEFVPKTLQRRLSEKDFFTRSGEGMQQKALASLYLAPVDAAVS